MYSGTPLFRDRNHVIGLIIEVAIFQGLIYTHVYVIGTKSMWLVEK